MADTTWGLGDNELLTVVHTVFYYEFDLWGIFLSETYEGYHEVKTRTCSPLKDKSWCKGTCGEKIQKAAWAAQGQSFYCLMNDFGEIHWVLCRVQRVGSQRMEMAGNKGRGLKVHSFWAIPGTRIPAPRDPWTNQPLRHLSMGLFKRLESEVTETTEVSISSAVQTHLKNNTFLLTFIDFSVLSAIFGQCFYQTGICCILIPPVLSWGIRGLWQWMNSQSDKCCAHSP